MPANRNRLAEIVTSFIIVGAIAFYLITILFLNAIRHQTNIAAAIDTSRFLEERFAGLQNHVRQFARDYNNWSDAYFATVEGNLTFLADNYGITAVNGDMFDGAILFDGPIPEPIAWRSGGERTPEPSFLSEAMLDSIREHVDILPPGDRPTFDFAVIIDGSFKLASASRILPDTKEELEAVDVDAAPIGVIFRSPLQSELDGIFSSLNLRKLEVATTASTGSESYPLQNVEGSAAVIVSWLPPLPGDRLLIKILPVLAFIFLMSVIVVAIGTRFLRKSAQELAAREVEALKLARTDALTSLPNRLALSDYLSTFEANRTDGLAIVLLDLDGFKNVNDLVGHAGGDYVIVEVAKRFARLASPNVFFSRVGGDEFVVVIHGDNLDEAVEGVSRTLLELISKPIVYQGSRFEVSSSCGVAIRNSPDQRPEDVMQCADRAMYHSKSQAGNQVTYYDVAMDEASAFDRRIERSLRSALMKPGEISVLYQPIVESSSGSLARVEALARWTSPQLGSVSPDVFIPIAERSGMICALGDLIFKIVAEDMQRNREIRVSVNVSPLQLMSPGFVERLTDVFVRTRIAPKRIELELTEGIAVQNLDGVSNQLRELRSMGFTTALDDFGTGFSSFGYLSKMPFDTVKIDRSFVLDLLDHATVGEFVQPIIALGHNLGKKVTAEGVESERIAEVLLKAGCDFLQGYHFGRPQPIDVILREFAAVRSTEDRVPSLQRSVAPHDLVS